MRNWADNYLLCRIFLDKLHIEADISSFSEYFCDMATFLLVHFTLLENIPDHAMRVLTGQYQLNLRPPDRHTKLKNWNWASNILKGLSWCICRANTAHSLRVSVETIRELYHFLSRYQWAKAYWNHWQNQHLDSRHWKTSPFHKLWNVLDCKNAFSHIYLKIIIIIIFFLNKNFVKLHNCSSVLALCSCPKKEVVARFLPKVIFVTMEGFSNLRITYCGGVLASVDHLDDWSPGLSSIIFLKNIFIDFKKIIYFFFITKICQVKNSLWKICWRWTGIFEDWIFQLFGV